MSATINSRIKFKRDTTQNWNAAKNLVPLEGELIIYTDYQEIEKEINGETKTVLLPGMKIGDGMAYVQDLPFIDEELRDMLMTHIGNTDAHTTALEKLFWNNKINVDDAYDIAFDMLENETLVLNRN